MRALVLLLALLVPLSGCLGGNAPADATPVGDPLPSYDSAYDVVASGSGMDEPRSLRFVVEQDGEVVFDETLTLRPGEGPWSVTRQPTGCHEVALGVEECGEVEVTVYDDAGESLVSAWGEAEDCQGSQALFRFTIYGVGAGVQTGCGEY